MKSTIVGGAMLPHAPQFFTQPATEDPAVIDAVRAVAARIGAGLRALQADLTIIFSNDHAEQFFHHAAPPFTVHVGGEAGGEFAGRTFHWPVPGEIGLALVRVLYDQGFDPAFSSTAKIDYAIGIPLSHVGHARPVLPIYVNAYLPPQPTMERCYQFGQAIARTVTALGLKTIILSSGGMSHFPGTDRYSNPELAWDKRVLEKLDVLGLDKSVAGKFPSQLSGGMRKRVGLARALMLEPPILIYDEPTSGLDPLTSRLVDDLIDEMRQRFNVTSIVISHDIASCFRIAHQAILLIRGKVVARGTPDELARGASDVARDFIARSGVDVEHVTRVGQKG